MLSSVIGIILYFLSISRDANRLLKGQDVPFLHGDKRILQGYNVQIGGSTPAFNYDNFSHVENEKQFDGINGGDDIIDNE
jgi:hypothetical protein